MSDYMFTLPIYGVVKGKPINVNWYRNAHYHKKDKAKKKFKAMIMDQLDCLDPIKGRIQIKYTYYAKANNRPDLDNFVGTVKKFFQDALVESGLIEDDNVNIIVGNSERYGGIDKHDSRVEAVITCLD